jgi:hypothetical protein
MTHYGYRAKVSVDFNDYDECASDLFRSGKKHSTELSVNKRFYRCSHGAVYQELSWTVCNLYSVTHPKQKLLLGLRKFPRFIFDPGYQNESVMLIFIKQN